MIRRLLSLTLSLWIASLAACRPPAEIDHLPVEEGKRFTGVRIEKIWQKELYGRLVLALPQGVFCDEIQDRMGREHKFQLFGYDGRLIRERSLVSGQGPDEVTVVTRSNTWLTSAGRIMVEDNDYLKAIDPETFEVRTLAKFANAIRGFGSRFIFGRHTLTTFEERDGRTVTTFESAAFYENLTCHVISYRDLLEDFSVLGTFRLPRPLVWAKLEEGRRESLTDYYHLLRIHRIFTVDWARNTVYVLPNIEKPELVFVPIGRGVAGRFRIDLDPAAFAVDGKELERYEDYVRGQTDPVIKANFKQVLYRPSHAPALMGIKVVGDRLIVITGKRDWERQENEALVYRLPSMGFEGSFDIPYPNSLITRWDNDFYITEKRVKRNGDYVYDWEIYRIRFD